MYYALRIRIKYQALKAHPRELCTTHFTYPYYLSSAESPPKRVVCFRSFFLSLAASTLVRVQQAEREIFSNTLKRGQYQTNKQL